jgi:hypothetical protein
LLRRVSLSARNIKHRFPILNVEGKLPMKPFILALMLTLTGVSGAVVTADRAAADGCGGCTLSR